MNPAEPPAPGTIFRYAYLWSHEQQRGQEEGLKDRPALVLAVAVSASKVAALAITHSPPQNQDEAIALPRSVKKALGLDNQDSWVVLTEANVFTWPGPDLRNIPGAEPPTAIYGRIPSDLMQVIAQRTLDMRNRRRMRFISRTE
ncbi:MAG: hypothetical protein WDN01_13160 [Rhizomicrobium sp.]